MFVKYTLRIWVVFLLAAQLANSEEILLVPDFQNSRIAAFDPVDGALIDPDFIPADGNMSLPVNAIASNRNTIFVSDNALDAVLEYDFAGNFLGVVAGGIRAPSGIALRNENLYVTTFDDTVEVFDLEGGKSTLISGFGLVDIFFRGDDLIASEFREDNIESFAFDGTYNGPLHDSDGITGIDFPYQLMQTTNGEILSGAFDSTGIHVFDADGTEIDSITGVANIRGVFELLNGQILAVGSQGAFTWDRSTDQITMVTSGAYGFIESVTVVPEPSGFLFAVLSCPLLWRRRRAGT